MMGYFVTPPSVVDRIKKLLSFPEEPFAALDPCCGCGTALASLLEETPGYSYGVELDYARADRARKKLHRVVKGAYEAARISNRAFSLLFLNPPYDGEIGTETIAGKRKERTFLSGTVDYLAPGGVLIYVIPQYIIEKNIALILTYRFKNIRAFRFQGSEYDTYKQIVIFGIRKEKNYVDHDLAAELAQIAHKELPELPALPEPIYTVPVTEPDVPIFRSSILDPEEVLKEAMRSPLWAKVQEMTSEVSTVEEKRPPLPMRQGHLAMVLASGGLDGVVGKGGNRHLVRGRVIKNDITEEEKDKNGNVTTTVTESFAVHINTLLPDGTFNTLM